MSYRDYTNLGIFCLFACTFGFRKDFWIGLVLSLVGWFLLMKGNEQSSILNQKDSLEDENDNKRKSD